MDPSRGTTRTSSRGTTRIPSRGTTRNPNRGDNFSIRGAINSRGKLNTLRAQLSTPRSGTGRILQRFSKYAIYYL